MSEGASTPRWMWVAFIALTALSIGAVAVHASFFSFAPARLPLTPEPHWGLRLRHQWYEPMGYVSLAAPFAAAAALVFRRFRNVSLGLLAAAAMFQVTALALEYQWKQQEQGGEFDRPNFGEPVQ